MIQRIQTVFLLLAVIALGLFLWLPVIKLDTRAYKEAIQGWDVRHFYNGYIFFVNLILVGTAMGLSLINIFLYKSRDLQKLICWFAIVFIAAAAVYTYYKYTTKVFFGDVIFTPWNALLAVAAIFEILAYVYINKDENIIKSMDRLR